MAVMESVRPIDVKEAVQAAKRFATTIFEPEELSGLGLEAVELSSDRRHWLVTLGFSRPSLYSKSPLSSIVQSKVQNAREYRVFKVDAVSGEVLGFQLFKE